MAKFLASVVVVVVLVCGAIRLAWNATFGWALDEMGGPDDKTPD